MPNMTPQSLAAQLKNIGPKTAAMLIKAGIDSPEKLKKLGAKDAYMKILFSGGFCGVYHAAYLYALEGAILDCNWLHIPEKKRLEYKEFTEELRKKKKN